MSAAPQTLQPPLTASAPVVAPGLGWPGTQARSTRPLGWPRLGEDRVGGDTTVTPRHTASATVAGGVSRETPPLAAQLAREVARRRRLQTQTLPAPARTRVVTVANQKGGVGKTTTTVNLAAALVQSGMRVLVIDMDPQGNASTALGVPHPVGTAGVYDVLIDRVRLEDVIQASSRLPGLLCAPATIDLAGAEIELVPLPGREARLHQALHGYLEGLPETERVDYVFVDCPPSLGLLTVNAFAAAQEVLIPIQCEYYALEGLGQLLRNISLIQEHLNPGLEVSAILLTMYDARTRLAAQVAEEVRSHFPKQVLQTAIPRSVRISEAPSHGESVMTYDPGSTGALCYLEAAAELARQTERTPA